MNYSILFLLYMCVIIKPSNKEPETPEEEKKMEKYKITVSGTEYNEEYFFEVPKEGKIEEEIAAIIEEVKAGGISKFTVEEVRDTCKKTIPCCGCADMEVCTKKKN